jgi:hypothetical protein
MRLTRVRGSELAACLCGAALLASLSLDWFDAGAEPVSGWSALGFIDAFLALTGGLAVGLPLLSASQEKTDLTITATAIVCLLAMLGLVMLIYRVLDPPGSTTREAGVFVALAACLGISLSTWRGMADDGTARAAV